MRGSTLIAGHRMIGLSFDGYGVTGPDWGLSEMVFVRFPHKTLPPVPFSILRGVSLCLCFPDYSSRHRFIEDYITVRIFCKDR